MKTRRKKPERVRCEQRNSLSSDFGKKEKKKQNLIFHQRDISRAKTVPLSLNCFGERRQGKVKV